MSSHVIEQLTQQRDEALAQVAVFIKECSCHDWTSERLFSMVVDKARIFLDRLQRAEIVVEMATKLAASLVTGTVCIPSYSVSCPGGDHRHLSQQEQEALVMLAGFVQHESRYPMKCPTCGGKVISVIKDMRGLRFVCEWSHTFTREALAAWEEGNG